MSSTYHPVERLPQIPQRARSTYTMTFSGRCAETIAEAMHLKEGGYQIRVHVDPLKGTLIVAKNQESFSDQIRLVHDLYESILSKSHIVNRLPITSLCLYNLNEVPTIMQVVFEVKCTKTGREYLILKSLEENGEFRVAFDKHIIDRCVDSEREQVQSLEKSVNAYAV